jgi:16S rRNA (guanine527-N7)-methyltransferase
MMVASMPQSGFLNLLKNAFPGIRRLSSEQAAAVERHYCLLLKWNKVINLVSSTTLDNAAERHYAESFVLAAHMPEGVLTVADAGSGAGFPGFPLAVMYPEVVVTLVESDQRKAAFLREACGDLSNVRVVTARFETIRECYAGVVSRAVRPSQVLRWALAHAAHIGLLVGADQALELSGHPRLTEVRRGAISAGGSSCWFWGAVSRGTSQ